MINLQILGALLRTLRTEPGGLERPAPLPVAGVRPALRVADKTEETSASVAARGSLRTRVIAQPIEAAKIDPDLNGSARNRVPVDRLSTDSERARLEDDPRRAAMAVAIPSRAGASIGSHAMDLLGLRGGVGESIAAGARGGAVEPESARPELTSASLRLTSAASVLHVALADSPVPLEPPLIASFAPLATMSDASAVAIARALHADVATSGLFYESHLARLARDDYPLSLLQAEPQAAWKASATSRESVAETQSLAMRMQTAVGAPADASTPSEAVGGRAPIEPAPAMVERQLAALETRALVWTGEVWPGQRATIRIAEDDEPEEPARPDQRTSAAWQTRIDAELPNLGHVSAVLLLDDGRLSLRLRAESPALGEHLTRARHELADALVHSRLSLAEFAVGP